MHKLANDYLDCYFSKGELFYFNQMKADPIYEELFG